MESHSIFGLESCYDSGKEQETPPVNKTLFNVPCNEELGADSSRSTSSSTTSTTTTTSSTCSTSSNISACSSRERSCSIGTEIEYEYITPNPYQEWSMDTKDATSTDDMDSAGIRKPSYFNQLRFRIFCSSKQAELVVHPFVDSGIVATSCRSRSIHRGFASKIPPSISLPMLVLLDMFAVSLVVPLLFQYYKQAGISNASERELFSSLFSLSQIAGGLILGALADARLVQRRTILFLSFGGSAVAYGLLVLFGDNLMALVVSRILVGLVKQTMTVTTTILTRCTTKENRAQHIGRLSASGTVAWIVGPSVGAFLYQNVDHRAPLLLACVLFIVNIILAGLLLPSSFDDVNAEASLINDKKTISEKGSRIKQEVEKCSIPNKVLHFFYNLNSCFSSKNLGFVTCSVLIYTWVAKATNPSNLGSFYEDMYGIEPHHRGYLSSYQQALNFFVQSILAGPILRWCRGERRAACLCTVLLSAAVVLQYQRSLLVFLAILCPVMSINMSIINLSLQTLVTQHVTPTDSTFSVLAALDVLQNVVSVTVPFYRTILFVQLKGITMEEQKGVEATTLSGMSGDPDPIVWVLTSSIHWCITACVIGFLLLSTGDSHQLYRKKSD